MLSELTSFNRDCLRPSVTVVKSIADIYGKASDEATGCLEPKSPTQAQALDAARAAAETAIAVRTNDYARGDDGRWALIERDERLTASADACHGRCFGFEEERATWAAPRLALGSAAEARPGYNSLSKSEYLDDEVTLKAKVAHVARLLNMAKCPVVYAGAGLSTAAGIGDYASLKPLAQLGGSPMLAQPTLGHRVIAALGNAGHVHRMVQQNHDGLPQKAGMPQQLVNEIHGALHDPSNPVVPMSGNLRSDLFADLLDCEARADLTIAVGTSLCGMNSDRCVATPAAKAARGQALGAVVIGLQRTVVDESATVRIFATIDRTFELLAEAMDLEVPPAALGFFRPAVLGGDAAGDDKYVLCGLRYDARGRRCAEPNWATALDVRDGAQLVLAEGPHAGARGEVDGTDREGAPKCRFKVRLKKGATVLHPWGAPLGLWHLQAAADATVAQLPVVNPPADDDTSEAAEAVRALVAAYAAGE